MHIYNDMYIYINLSKNKHIHVYIHIYIITESRQGDVFWINFYFVIKVEQKDLTLSRLCFYLSESTRGTNTKTMSSSPYIHI